MSANPTRAVDRDNLGDDSRNIFKKKPPTQNEHQKLEMGFLRGSRAPLVHPRFRCFPEFFLRNVSN
jgi:hypothetical protein